MQASLALEPPSIDLHDVGAIAMQFLAAAATVLAGRHMTGGALRHLDCPPKSLACCPLARCYGVPSRIAQLSASKWLLRARLTPRQVRAVQNWHTPNFDGPRCTELEWAVEF